MDGSSDCFYPVNGIDSKLNCPTRLDDNLESGDEISVSSPKIEAVNKNTRDSENNSVLFILSKLPGEFFPTIYHSQ